MPPPTKIQSLELEPCACLTPAAPPGNSGAALRGACDVALAPELETDFAGSCAAEAEPTVPNAIALETNATISFLSTKLTPVTRRPYWQKPNPSIAEESLASNRNFLFTVFFVRPRVCTVPSETLRQRKASGHSRNHA